MIIRRSSVPLVELLLAVAVAGLGVAAIVVLCGHLLYAEPPPGSKPIGYTLKHAPATRVAEQLRTILPANPQAEVTIGRDGHRVLVRASAESQQLAAQLVAALDRPQPKTVRQPDTSAQPIVKAYAVGLDRLQGVSLALERTYPPATGVRVVPDARTGQLLVVAVPEVQRAIAEQLERDPTSADSETTTTAEGAQQRPESTPEGIRQRRLEHITCQQLENALREFLGQSVTVRSSGDGELATIQLAGRDGQGVELRMDRTTNLVTFLGPARPASAWMEIVTALDQPQPNPQYQTKLVSLRHAKRNNIQRALSFLQSQRNTSDADTIAVARVPQAGQGTGTSRGLVPLLAQRDDRTQTTAQAQDNAQPQPAPGQAEQPAEAPEAAVGGGLIGQVQIEYLEGSDVIVIRGHQRDVQRVMEIIRDIEQRSIETEPEVQILPLEYVDSRRMETMVNELYLAVYQVRQGTVSITALVKPNALLLIGRPENVRTVVDLVKKLDQPIDPETQFHVFQLEHISAVEAQTMIREFFDNAAAPNEATDRGGLGTRVRVTADPRSNALLVQASARDLAEVQRLLKQVDVATSRVVSQVQIFQLRNSRAEDLAPVLQRAISGQDGGGAAAQQGPLPGQVTPTDPGAAAARGGGAAQGQSAAAMLTFAEGDRILRSGIMRDVRVNADPATNSLIVTAPEEAMGLVAALIQRLDQPAPAEAQLKVFQLENGNASDVRTMLEEMFPADTQQGQAGFPGAAATGDTTLVPLRFSVDVRTNSIIASGTPSDLRVVNAIIVVLDSSDVRQRQNLVYRLRYTQAADVAAAIQQFLDAEQQRTQQQIQQLVQATQVGLSPFEQIEREVVVVAEPLSNTLIISATPRFYDQIVEIVREIDSIPPMVMIQVLIAQVSYEHQEQFGVELGIQDSLLFDREDLLVDPPGRSVLGIPFFIDQNAITTGQNVAAQGLTDLSLGRQNTEFGFGGLVIAAGSESVNILIRALEQRARVDLLARPQIMTLDNQPSRIQLGQEVRLPSATSVTEAGITNLTTEERQVGVILDVLPRISPDGTVAILVSAERSRLGPEAQGTAIGFDQDGNVIRTPNVDLATAFTTISVRSGQTAVFSGLLTKDTIMITRGVPILSDLPVIGNAFRFDSADTSETELLIIMTPHVIRTPEDMHRINAIESSRMSWCLADVVRLHADPGLVGDESNWHGSDIMTIYPDGEPVELEPSSTESRAKSTDTSSVSRWRRLLATMRPQAKRAALPRGAAGHDLQENNWQANEMGSGEESIADSDRSLMGLGPAEGLPPAVNRVEPTAYPPLAPADRPKRLPGTR